MMHRLLVAASPLRRSAIATTSSATPRPSAAAAAEVAAVPATIDPLRPTTASAIPTQRWYRTDLYHRRTSAAAAVPTARPRPLASTSARASSGGGGGASTQNAAHHTRLAGRRRFYDIVGIAPARPPWEHFDRQEEADEEGKDGMVESPISAGVDGTQSASGVSIRKSSAETMREFLTPNNNNPGGGGGGGGGEGTPEWHGVTLDGRPIRTPLGTPLTVPSPILAGAIASEWDAQITSITPAQMPLTTLACTALDQIGMAGEEGGANVVRDNVLRYLRNDTTCYWTCPTEDRVLNRRQVRAWEELHTWATQHLGAAPARAMGSGEGLVMSRARKSKPIAGLPHPDVLMDEAELWVNGLDGWRLAALQAVTTESKSFLVGMAVVMGADAGGVGSDGAAGCAEEEHDEQHQTKQGSDGGSIDQSPPPYADTKDAVEASRVEEEFQIENWGLVEGGHDYDRLNCSVSVHSAAVLVGSIVSAV